MADNPTGARRNAQNHFAASEQRNVAVRQMIDAERKVLDDRTAKLRALRLAKEAADAAAAPAPKPKAKKTKAV
jgi:hypothetical protein